MKKFLIKISLFFAILLIVLTSLFGVYYFKFQHLNRKLVNESVFIWGDSQAEAGFNLEVIKEISGKQIYSSAAGGTGAFDFLSFSEIVPENSSVIISISQLSLLRKRDKNQTGIPVFSLPKLLSIGYPDLLYSIRQNITPKSIFWTDSKLYPLRDTLTFHEPLEKFIEIYTKKDQSFSIKAEAYLYGIKRLVQKKCKVVFVTFPVHKKLTDVVPDSFKAKYKDFMSDVYKELDNNVVFDTIYFSDQNRNMYDLTHLNEKGATDFSEKLFQNQHIFKDKILFISVNGGEGS